MLYLFFGKTMNNSGTKKGAKPETFISCPQCLTAPSLTPQIFASQEWPEFANTSKFQTSAYTSALFGSMHLT